MKRNKHLIIIFLFLFYTKVFSQEDFNHPELEWRTIETKHFLIHFHIGAERTAKEIAKIAESIYHPITKLYSHEPDQKVNFIIRDHDDYSNGAAYFYDNRIEIWATALDYELRGTHPWLWNVVTHEFTHIIQIQTTMKFGRKIPGMYFQWLGYEAERRPDVLYGYPNVLVSYPYSGFVVPMWFAEGTAQYNNPALDYDYWDSHRDMILRMYMIEGNPLSWEEMAVFGKTSLGNESSYNAGFSIVQYISEKYGMDKVVEISRQLSAPFRMTIDGAIKNVLGITGYQLYEEWKQVKTNYYKKIADEIIPNQTVEEILENEGFGNFYPAFSPDGSKLAYISNKGHDYFLLSNIYIYDFATKKSKLLIPNVRSSLSFSPDNKYIYYSKITRDNPHWSAYSDLYRYDLIKEKEERLTFGLRAFNPKLSSDGKKLVFATNKDGTMNISICNSDGKNISAITKFIDGEQVYTPVWSPDGRKIAFGFSKDHNQSLAIIDTNGTNIFILDKSEDCRNPFFATDSTLIYSWARNGIFNIYELNLNRNEECQITNVLGGAFLPSVNSQGDIAFVPYKSSGYKIGFLKSEDIKRSEPNVIAKTAFYNFTFRTNKDIDEKLSAESSVSNININGITGEFTSKTYRHVFTNLTLIPFLRVDNYNVDSKGIDIIKPGLYFTSSEVLDKMNIFGGVAINRILERDLFLIFEYKDRLPLLYQLGLEPTATLELYNISRKRKNVSFNLYLDRLQTFYADITYNLFEFDFSLRQKIISENIDLKLMYTYSSYSQDFGSWFHPTFGVIPASRSTYFIGNMFSAQLKYNGIIPTLDKEINPIGRSIMLKYSYEWNKFNPRDSIKIEDGLPVPIYTKYNLNRIELIWNEHIALPFKKHTLSFTLNTAGIIGDSVDDFFDYYGGGFIGMRGYPFYAIGGNKMLTLNTAYRFPIFTKLNFRLLQFYFTKLFGSVFFDIGDAWYKEITPIKKWKKDIGFELRLESFSFYAYPTRIFFSGAYGLDKFSRKVENFNDDVTYGQEWRFYLGILFGFELNDLIPRFSAR